MDLKDREMKKDTTMPEKDVRVPKSRITLCLLLAMVLLCGCQSAPPADSTADTAPQNRFALERIATGQAIAILSKLGVSCTTTASDPNTIVVRGSPEQVEKAAMILDIIDVNEPFIVETLSPASKVRALPSNSQISLAVGGLAIGTFAEPPEAGRTTRAIIDVFGDAVIAVVPAQLWPDIHAVVALGPEAKRQQQTRGSGLSSDTDSVQMSSSADDALVSVPDRPDQATIPLGESSQTRVTAPGDMNKTSDPTDIRVPVNGLQASEPNAIEPEPVVSSELRDRLTTARGVLKPSPKTDRPASVVASHTEISFPNGDDVLELTLPEKIELSQLLDLAGQYLGLDCIYEAETIGNQTITLKLHSRMRSEMRVKDLYSLLGTILKFKGLVMTRLEGNLVSIVPASEAMEIDPALVDPNSAVLQAGDVVVTRVFELQHVDASSITNLLQNMKLSIAVSPIPETQTLFVTCYAHRMARIEQLVDMADRPGKPREFRFRQLTYTMAATVSRKLSALATELEGISINSGMANPGAPSQRNPQPGGQAGAGKSAAGTTVYLDTDDRTNRILMIGPCEQLETVEGLIDALDVPQQDLRTLHVYEIKQTTAQAALDKLKQLGVIDKAGTMAKTGKATGTTESAPEDEPQVVLLEATNSLLVNATTQQHAQIRMVLDHVDVIPQDLRTMRVYSIRHVDAENVARKLQQIAGSSQAAASVGGVSKAAQVGTASASSVGTGAMDALISDAPQVIVLEVTNSLLVNATPAQHEKIDGVLRYIDTAAPRETVPYEIYFLENQDPEQLSQVLGKLIQETILNAEGKVEKTIAKTDEEVTIIPDKNTFSLIVHANRKNQDWIAGLVEKLDKRRPQVLIDVTLVEITETDAFNYDLNLITSAPNLLQTSGLTGTIVPGSDPVTSGDIMDRLVASNRSQFAELQSDSGELTAFYGDKHINLLLQAMQSRNYGRVLAKPKILVNDNEPGTIKTADMTYVAKRSSVPVSSGGAGTDATLIETAVSYESYEAGITLNITPHISQGNLLRMEIDLTRSDFRETDDTEKPPDTTTSELKTTAFVPDASTIILGGLLRLNQNKGGTKVPLLGDIPIIGGLFRTINNKDSQSKLYVFVKAEIIRPEAGLAQEMRQLETLSERDRKAFEEHEREFQGYENWPGIKSKPTDPPKVLDAR